MAQLSFAQIAVLKRAAADKTGDGAPVGGRWLLSAHALERRGLVRIIDNSLVVITDAGHEALASQLGGP